MNQLRIVLANQNDTTPKKVLGDKMLMDIVQMKPQSTHNLKSKYGIGAKKVVLIVEQVFKIIGE